MSKFKDIRNRNEETYQGCDDPGPRTMARYWSCKKW